MSQSKMLKSLFILFLAISVNGYAGDIKGEQPNLSIDAKGVLRMVYGQGENIFCSTSENNGASFSAPVQVAKLPGMHLGHTRGPQIASSKNYSVITAIDQEGNIHSYKLKHAGGKWIAGTDVNDVKGKAVEGLMALTADSQDNFFATWLDIRLNKTNNIFFSALNATTDDWSKNRLVYQSPDGHVCECCKPNITYTNNKLVVGFRNWLLGSRDIYYSVSADKGKTFSAPKKSGKGTWRLNACPMDGGGLAVNANGNVAAAWRRNSDVFYASGSGVEQKLGNGRDVSMAQGKGKTIVAWQEKNNIRVMNLANRAITDLGNGSSPKVYVLANGKTICVWEDSSTIKHKII